MISVSFYFTLLQSCVVRFQICYDSSILLLDILKELVSCYNVYVCINSFPGDTNRNNLIAAV